LGGVHAQHPEDLFFLVPAVASRVNADGGQFAALAPALDGKGGNTENVGHFGDG